MFLGVVLGAALMVAVAAGVIRLPNLFATVPVQIGVVLTATADASVPTATITDAPTVSPTPIPTATATDIVIALTATTAPTPTDIPPEPTAASTCEASGAGMSAQTVAPEQAAAAAQAVAQGGDIPEGRTRAASAPRQRQRNRVIIHFTPESTRAERDAYAEQIDGRVRRRLRRVDAYVVVLPRDVEPASLPASPIVVSIEGDYYVAAASPVERQADPMVTVNDPLYGEQWGLGVIGAAGAWARLTGDARGVTVAVIDSGVCSGHPDLSGRVGAGWDFVEDDADAQDAYGHGCGVAGIIAGVGDNGIGMAGVAPNATIMPLRVLDGRGLGSTSDVAAAIVYAADNGADVINLSLAGAQNTLAVREAVAYAVGRGMVVVAAAGNTGREGALYPAAYDGVIAVGSVGRTLAQSRFSNFGANVDVTAPGEDIWTTTPDGQWTTLTGTSFAAPHVSGIAALEIAFGRRLAYTGATQLAHVGVEAVCG